MLSDKFDAYLWISLHNWKIIKQSANALASALFLVIIVIFYNIAYFAIKYAAKIINFHSADAAAFFHSVNSGTADVMLIDEGICRYFLSFKRFPEGLITYHFIYRSPLY